MNATRYPALNVVALAITCLIIPLPTQAALQEGENLKKRADEVHDTE
jgi:hypothetical protein